MPVSIHRATDGTEGSDDGEIEIAISSETPVRRFDFLEWDVVEEILDHDSIDLSRAKDGLPLLLDHDPRIQVGLITNVRVDRDRVLRGRVQFGSHPDAGWVEKDMRAGIRRGVSVGASFARSKRTLIEERKNGPNLYRVRQWMPSEASSVAMAADLKVGVGRSADGARRRPGNQRPDDPAPAARRHKVDETQTTPAQTGVDVEKIKRETEDAVRVTAERAAEGERERVSEILAIANEHGLGDSVKRWVDSRYSVEQVNAEVKDLKARNLLPVRGGPAIDLSPKERKRYSIARAILIESGDPKFSDGIEKDISEQLQRDGYTARKGGTMVPTSLVQLNRSVNSITVGEGAEAVFDKFEGFIDLLRPRALAFRFGVQMRSGLRENFVMVRQTGAATLEWRGENTAEDDPNGDTAESQVSFDTVTLTPKSAQATTGYTRQELRRAVFAVDDAIERDLVKIHALGLDRVVFHGAGGDQPLGLYGIVGVNPVPAGGAISHDLTVDMETAVAVANADDLGAMGYVTTPEVRGVGKKTEQFAGTSGRPLWTGTVAEGELNGYRAGATNQIAKNLGVGTNEHGMLFGVWSEGIVGEWGVLEIITDPLRLKKQGIIELTSFQMLDFNVRNPGAFSKATGLTL